MNPMRMMVTQTGALFLDAYRELNARKMFWIVLVISAVVVLGFAGVGIDANGFSLFGMAFANGTLNTNVISKPLFYKAMFDLLGVQWWLTLWATVLAIVSTAGIFPDFVSSGSVDLFLARPISRLRLFLTKYAAALLFVTLQVSLFCTASFFVLGFRAGSWSPRLFIAIPFVVCFFSYLYGICALIGVRTRSTVSAILLTMLCWFAIYAVDVTEGMLSHFLADGQEQVSGSELRVKLLDSQIAALQRDGRAGTTTQPSYMLHSLQRERDAAADESTEAASGLHKLGVAHDIAYGLKTFVPKTQETLLVLYREMLTEEETASRKSNEGAAGFISGIFSSGRADNARGGRRQHFRLPGEHSTWWIIGTSLAFEAVTVGLAAWIFCRRDY